MLCSPCTAARGACPCSGLITCFAALLSRATGIVACCSSSTGSRPSTAIPPASTIAPRCYRELQATVPPGVPLVIAGDSAGGGLSLVTVDARA